MDIKDLKEAYIIEVLRPLTRCAKCKVRLEVILFKKRIDRNVTLAVYKKVRCPKCKRGYEKKI